MLLLLLPLISSAASISDLTPVSHWQLDEESGVRYDAVEVSGNDLTDNNTVLFGTGALGNAADFEDTNSEYLSITDALQTGLDLSGDFSFSTWVKFETDQIQIFMDKYRGTTGNRQYQFYYHSGAGSIILAFSDDCNSAESIQRSWSPSTGVWYHVVGTVNISGSEMKIYVDGSQLGTTYTHSQGNPCNSARPFQIGKDYGSSYYDGLIDESSVFDYTLTADQVSTLYNSGTPLLYEESTASSSNLVLIPYNTDMPKLESVSASGTSYIMNYATSTEVYLTPENLFLLLLSGILVAFIFGYLAYKFL